MIFEIDKPYFNFTVPLYLNQLYQYLIQQLNIKNKYFVLVKIQNATTNSFKYSLRKWSLFYYSNPPLTFTHWLTLEAFCCVCCTPLLCHLSFFLHGLVQCISLCFLLFSSSFSFLYSLSFFFFFCICCIKTHEKAVTQDNLKISVGILGIILCLLKCYKSDFLVPYIVHLFLYFFYHT